MSTLPDWWEPLAGRAATARRSDFTRWPTPPVGGRPSAVLILLGEQPGTGPDVLILQRAATLRSHAGQPAFPGGAADPEDADATATALREATEEVGLDPAGVEVVALLPDLYLGVTDFLITPVVGWWRTRGPVGVADPGEVARVEAVPLAELADPANRHYVRHPSGYLSLAFSVRGMIVWGFTAIVLDGMLTLGGWARDWDQTDIRDLPRPAPTAPAGDAEDTVAPYEPEPSGDPITVPPAAPASASGPVGGTGRMDPPGTVAG